MNKNIFQASSFILDLFQSSIRWLKWHFLSSCSKKFSSIYIHILSKFTQNAAKKFLVFLVKASFKRGLLLYLLIFPFAGSTFPVSKEIAEKIAIKVWYNECRCSIEGLSSWNEGENFASLGIAHFIWYPSNEKRIFQESFPDLLKFMERQGVIIPQWLVKCRGCPWKTRSDFQANKDSKMMKALRRFLYRTREVQALYLIKRIQRFFSKMSIGLSSVEKEKIEKNFFYLASSPQGLYVLIDYVNFKGEGLSLKDQCDGYGLRYVLLHMNLEDSSPIEAFVNSAKYLLEQRVKNAPKERNEERWLPGWHNRLNSY